MTLKQNVFDLLVRAVEKRLSDILLEQNSAVQKYTFAKCYSIA